MQHRQTVRTTLAVWLALCGIAGAGDWPQFRGPTGQGIAPGETRGLPTTWSESDNIRWKAAVEGLGWSSPVVVDRRVYVTTAVPLEEGESQSLQVVCLCAETGEELWRTHLFQQVGKVDIHDKNSHASPTPLIAGDRIYAHFGPHGTACVTTEGAIVWRNEGLEYGPRHGTGSSPALAGDVLVIPCDGIDVQYVVGLEASSGAVRWKVERNANPRHGFSFSTPLVIEAAGRTQAICPGSSAVVSYDPGSGEELWRARYGSGYSVVPRPVFAHGLVYVCTGFGTSKLMAIDPSGSGDVTESHVKWETEKNVPKSPSLLVVGDELYMVSDQGIATCLDARSGEQVWQERLGGNFSASPVYAEGRIYFQDEDGTSIVVKAGREFAELGRSTWGDGGRTYASYAVADGALFLRSATHVYRVEAAVRQTGG